MVRLQMVYEDSQDYRVRPLCSTPEQVYTLMSPVYKGLPREVLFVLSLNARNQVLAVYPAGMGTADRCPAHAREVFSAAIVSNGLKIVLTHNHPGGSVEPSAADLKLTRTLAEAGDTLGIPLVDHLIITEDGYASLRERGHI